MPTKQARIMFSPTPESHALLLRMSAATGQPMSGVVRDMIETIAPHLEQMCTLLERASKLSEGVREAASAAARDAGDALIPALVEAERAMRKLEQIVDEPGLPLVASEPPSSNTGATWDAAKRMAAA